MSEGALSASASTDAWNPWQGSKDDPRLLFEGYTGWVKCLAFAPDGMHLVFGNSAGEVRLWSRVPSDVLSSEREAIRAARFQAATVVESLWRQFDDPQMVAEHVTEDSSLSRPLRRAALNEVLRRALQERQSEDAP